MAWRWHYHPARRVTFVVDTNPNYTDVCRDGGDAIPAEEGLRHADPFGDND